ncbi:MAG TPA: glutaredoxin family protein [Spirochaetota bacterium]|nr:glutaredoxin family protein [Spirochaetota bacterium]
MAEMTHVDGKNVGTIVLYALSTCIWCKKAKSLLDELKLAYSYVYVDLLESAENAIVKDNIRQWNPRCSFPTLVINDHECIIGFDEEKIRGLVK